MSDSNGQHERDSDEASHPSHEPISEGELRFRQLIEQADALFWMLDPDITELLYASPAYETMWGRSREGLRLDPTSWVDSVHPDDRAEILQGMKDLSIFDRDHEFRIIHPENGVRWIHSHMFRIRDRDGNVCQVAGFMTDVTARREAEEALKKREYLFAEAQRLANVGSWEGDFVTFKEVWSDQFYRMLGFDPSEPASFERFFAMIHPEDQPAISEKIAEPRPGEFEYEYRLIRPGGEIRWHQGRAEIIADEEGNPIRAIGTSQDVTARKNAENALRASEEQHRLLFERSPNPMWVFDPSSLRYLAVNDAAVAHYGYTRKEFLSMSILDIRPEAEVPKINRLFQRPRPTAGNWISARHRKKNGEIVDVEVISHDVIFANRNARLTMVLDVTERNRAERAIAAALGAAEKASHAKSEFLSRMSHELRTPLNAILGFGQLLENDPTVVDRESVEQILRGGRHLVSLIDEVLDLARIESGRVSVSIEPIFLPDLLAEVVDLIGPVAAQHEIRVDVARSRACGGYVRADQQRLKQVLLNLVSNGIKYNRPGGSVAIECEAYGSDRVRLLVRDTGKGITSDDLERLFTPFQRLGAERTGIEGTGLGLVLSRGLVEAMDGTMGVDSRPGSGSLFWVELPSAEAAAEPGQIVEPFLEPVNEAVVGTKLILYIEDNVSNLRLLERILKRRPELKLIAAMQGSIGLDLAREHQPDLVLLDLHLPDMGGKRVLDALRRDPATADVPVIIISADATQGEIDRLLAAGASAYVTKPFDVRNLFRTINEMIGSRSSA